MKLKKKEEEIYKGEYEGWLQFRWGDGKNAIVYVEPKKPKEKGDEPFYYPERNEIEDYLVGDELQDKFDDMEDKEIISGFIKQFYMDNLNIPNIIFFNK